MTTAAAPQVGWSALQGPAAVTRVSRAVAVAAAAMCLVVLIGWWREVEVLTSLGTGSLPMNINTAFAGLGVALALLFWQRQVVLGLGFFVSLISVATLINFAAIEAGIQDENGFVKLREWTTFSSTDMPLSSAIALFASGLALLRLGRGATEGVALLCRLTFLVGGLSLIGHLYGVRALYAIDEYTTMPPATAILMLALGVATSVRVPDGLTHWMVTSNDAGALLMRRAAGVGLVAIPGVGFLGTLGESQGLYGTRFGIALLVVASSFVVVLTSSKFARALTVADVRRQEAMESIKTMNADLEERVRVRSEELERERTLSAVYADRERIASDLHDRVIQRVFAAGLQLRGVMVRTPEELQPSLTGAMEELDGSIVALRGAIFALSQPADSVDTGNALVDLANRARRFLGFSPKVQIVGDLSLISPRAHDEITAVVQEALSNVARHAQATSVRVELRVDARTIRLEICDDGVGVDPKAPAGSGRGNVVKRAQSLGGDAEWLPFHPRGTRLVWEVPTQSGRSPSNG